MIKTRQSWDKYFIDLATQISTRSTCDRASVGTVIVRDHSVLSLGYNGSLPGLPHCDEIGHLIVDNHCVRVSHSESNAIAQAAKNGIRLDGSTLYCTLSPCLTCFKLAVVAGIKKFVYKEFYRDNTIFDFANQLGVELIHFNE